MTTTLSDKGEVALPRTLREKFKLKPGDDFEIIVDEPDTDRPEFVLRKRPKHGDWLEVLRACPIKDFAIPTRSRSLQRKVRL